MQIDKLLLDLRDQRNRIEIDEESYHDWKAQRMTQALFLDLEIKHIDCIALIRSIGVNGSHITGQFSKLCGSLEQLENFVDWRPAEIEDD